jgi:hypothetical protein
MRSQTLMQYLATRQETLNPEAHLEMLGQIHRRAAPRTQPEFSEFFHEQTQTNMGRQNKTRNPEYIHANTRARTEKSRKLNREAIAICRRLLARGIPPGVIGNLVNERSSRITALCEAGEARTFTYKTLCTLRAVPDDPQEFAKFYRIRTGKMCIPETRRSKHAPQNETLTTE